MYIREELKHQNMEYCTTADRSGCLLQKGQRILYEGEEAHVIKVKPLLVIKTRDRVICGALPQVDRR
jgi:hypothetical protein